MKLGVHSYFLGQDQTEPSMPEVQVGKFTSIAGGVYIHGADNHACVPNKKLVSTFDFGDWNVDFTRSGWSKGPVTIGSDVWIGEHVKILSGMVIGDGAIIGAHSVVSKDIPPYAVAVGSPIVIKKFRFTKKQIEVLLRIKWWDWSDEVIGARLGEMRDIEVFVNKYG